jgi:hypothetical protein
MAARESIGVIQPLLRLRGVALLRCELVSMWSSSASRFDLLLAGSVVVVATTC